MKRQPTRKDVNNCMALLETAKKLEEIGMKTILNSPTTEDYLELQKACDVINKIRADFGTELNEKQT
jgi:hypothetical protein